MDNEKQEIKSGFEVVKSQDLNKAEEWYFFLSKRTIILKNQGKRRRDQVLL
jgi:hypothetical protein